VRDFPGYFFADDMDGDKLMLQLVDVSDGWLKFGIVTILTGPLISWKRGQMVAKLSKALLLPK